MMKLDHLNDFHESRSRNNYSDHLLMVISRSCVMFVYCDRARSERSNKRPQKSIICLLSSVLLVLI